MRRLGKALLAAIVPEIVTGISDHVSGKKLLEGNGLKYKNSQNVHRAGGFGRAILGAGVKIGQHLLEEGLIGDLPASKQNHSGLSQLPEIYDPFRGVTITPVQLQSIIASKETPAVEKQWALRKKRSVKRKYKRQV